MTNEEKTIAINSPASPSQKAQTEELAQSPQPSPAPGESHPERPQSVLVVAAHPDDAEFGSGGTVATWAKQGTVVNYLICTRGDKGTDDPSLLPYQLMEMRVREQCQAAQILGVKNVDFLEFRDGELSPSLELRRAIVGSIRRYKPEMVITHDPSNLFSNEFINHPDHRAVGQATLDAIYPTARDRLQFPEHLAQGLEPHKVMQVLMWGSQQPNYLVDIGEAFDLKLESLRQHFSQITFGDTFVERMRERHQKLGEAQGLNLAEGFRRISLAR